MYWKTTLKAPMTMIPALDQTPHITIRILGFELVFPEVFSLLGGVPIVEGPEQEKNHPEHHLQRRQLLLEGDDGGDWAQTR